MDGHQSGFDVVTIVISITAVLSLFALLGSYRAKEVRRRTAKERGLRPIRGEYASASVMYTISRKGYHRESSADNRSSSHALVSSRGKDGTSIHISDISPQLNPDLVKALELKLAGVLSGILGLNLAKSSQGWVDIIANLTASPIATLSRFLVGNGRLGAFHILACLIFFLLVVVLVWRKEARLTTLPGNPSFHQVILTQL